MRITLPRINVLGIDPGSKTTGIALIYTPVGEQHKLPQLIDQTFSFDEILESCAHDFVDNEKIFPFFLANIWIVERWFLYQSKSQEMINNEFEAVQVIGMLKAMAKRWDKPIKFYNAVHVKNFCNDERLKEYGYWPKNVHARDAARHALFYLITDGGKVKSG